MERRGMTRSRIILVAAVTILVVIVALQNTQAVETQILFVTLTMPRAVLLFVTLLVGFVVGLVVASLRGRERATKTDP